jgi:hypothetical protein
VATYQETGNTPRRVLSGTRQGVVPYPAHSGSLELEAGAPIGEALAQSVDGVNAGHGQRAIVEALTRLGDFAALWADA